MKISGKTIIVTGGGNGIGRELSLQLLKGGSKVIAVDISADALDETKKLAGDRAGNFSSFVLNIADRNAVEQFRDSVLQAGVVDGLINNAGIIQPFVKVDDLHYDAIERVMNGNFYGTLYLIKAFLPHLKSRPVAHVMNVSSMGGFLPVPGQSVYGASKAAVKLLTEGLHLELKNTNVGVTIVFPGAIATNIAANSGVSVEMKPGSEQQQKFKALPVHDAAAKMIGAMESDAFRVTVGSDARFMDIIYRISPKRAAYFIYKKMKSLLGD
jgi:short-subunit dehydrogenase